MGLSRHWQVDTDFGGPVHYTSETADHFVLIQRGTVDDNSSRCFAAPLGSSDRLPAILVVVPAQAGIEVDP
jgi:hypothetical protein